MSHPRVYGENDVDDMHALISKEPSPRVRGKPLPAVETLSLPRAIPACTGKTLPD